MDTERFIIHIKIKGVYENIENDVKKRFDTSSYEIERTLPIRKNKKK